MTEIQCWYTLSRLQNFDISSHESVTNNYFVIDTKCNICECKFGIFQMSRYLSYLCTVPQWNFYIHTGNYRATIHIMKLFTVKIHTYNELFSVSYESCSIISTCCCSLEVLLFPQHKVSVAFISQPNIFLLGIYSTGGTHWNMVNFRYASEQPKQVKNEAKNSHSMWAFKSMPFPRLKLIFIRHSTNKSKQETSRQ
jgi:hypothetical protein